MCRLTVYKGSPMLIGDLITNPNNSLILQSRDAAYHPLVVDRTHRRNILVNGDGFGVAWYGNHIAKGSCLFKFVTPAWSNSNLRNIGDHVESGLIFAHIRAASSGHDPLESVAVSHENCHPFKYKNFTFMHNGGIPTFSKMKLKLLNCLDETFFQEIKGSTDSEHIFALFLTFLYRHHHLYSSNQNGGMPSLSRRRSNSVSSTSETTNTSAYTGVPPCPHVDTNGMEVFRIEEFVDAINHTVSTIIELMQQSHITDACSLNICVTDGIHIVATRFRNGTSNPPSLYYNFGSNFKCEDGVFYSSGGNKSPCDIVISSAPLSKVRAYQPSAAVNNSTANTSSSTSSSSDSGSDTSEREQQSNHDIHEEDVGSWILMPKNHMLVCRGDLHNPTIISSVKVQPITIENLSTSVHPFQSPAAVIAQKVLSAVNSPHHHPQFFATGPIEASSVPPTILTFPSTQILTAASLSAVAGPPTSNNMAVYKSHSNLGKHTDSRGGMKKSKKQKMKEPLTTNTKHDTINIPRLSSRKKDF